MKPVFAYESYRGYLLDYYRERHERGFTWRQFAAAAGYASPVFLKLVCDGKHNLSELGALRVAAAIGLSGAELAYFELLVRFEQEKDFEKKQEFFAELRKLAKACGTKVVGEDQYDYYDSWRNPVVRELAPLLPGAKASELAAEFLQETSAKEVKDALEVLVRNGLLKKSGSGFEKSETSVTTGKLEAGKLAVRNMHRQMGELAVKALDSVPAEERDISGMTLGLTEDAFCQIREELAAFRRRVAAIAMASPETERVYRMNLQLFPLTKRLGGGDD